MFDYFINNIEIIKWLAIGMLFIAVIIVFYSISSIKQDVPEENREYLDPLPPMLKKIWPLVNVFTFYIGDRLSVDTLEKYNVMLRKSGVIYMMGPAQYVGLRMASAFIAFILAIVIGFLLESIDYRLLVGMGLLGFYLPPLTMRDLRKKREKSIVKALPVYLDYLVMSLQAGMNLSGALQQAVDKGPKGNLRVEFSKVLRDVKAGMPRLDAIRDMAERNDIREMHAFSTAIIQAEKTGGSVGETLKIQADQRRIERFQKAEKQAMEAPVKLIFPLVAFILPMTFVIVFFPIGMKFLFEV